jgi:Zinc-binding dehydrogenase
MPGASGPIVVDQRPWPPFFSGYRGTVTVGGFENPTNAETWRAPGAIKRRVTLRSDKTCVVTLALGIASAGLNCEGLNSLDALGRSDWGEELDSNGIIFLYGLLSNTPAPFPAFEVLGRHLTIRGYELFEVTTDDQRLAKAKRFIVDGLASGALRPQVGKTFRLNQIVAAHRYMEANAQIGKIVVTVP